MPRADARKNAANSSSNKPGVPPASSQNQGGPPPPGRAQEEAQRLYNLRRIAHVPTDREIPDGVESMVLGDVVQRYKALRDVERRLDATLISKRFGSKDAGAKYERRLRTMRIWVRCLSTDAENGDARMDDTFEFGDNAGGGSYKLRIEGRLLPSDDGVDVPEEDEGGDTATMDVDKPNTTSRQDGAAAKPYFERRKFSHYFQSITVSFNPPRNALPDATVPAPIQWKKPIPSRDGTYPTTAAANFDALEIERKLDEGVQNITITLERSDPNGRARGKLSPGLARVLDREYDDQAGAMMGLYNYIRLNGLEQESNPQNFRCDEALKAIFGGAEVSSFLYLPEKIMENIERLPDVSLPFTIKLQPGASTTPTIYDVSVLVDDPVDLFTAHFHNTTTNSRNPDFIKRLEAIAQLDKDIALAVQGMYASKAKVDFMNGLASEPVGFVKKWVSSQQADEKIILAEDKGRGPEWHRGGDASLWASDVARESVGLMLARMKPL